MKKVLLAAAAVACFGTVAMAGPNAGGTLIVVSDGVIYCGDNAPYCGAGSTQDCNQGNAQAAGARVDPIVLHVLGAFAPTASPRVSGVVFGMSYNAAEVFITDLGGCGDFELADDVWPQSGSGTAVTWNAAQTGQIIDVYWVAAYNYYGNPNQLALTPHPSQGSSWADDSVPAELDDIAGLGAFGFDTAGELPCPEGAPGACCDDATGDCTIVFEVDCAGRYDGGPTCDPNPCPPPAIWACCAQDLSCSMQDQASCEASGGDWVEFATCADEPCIVPVVESTWGEIKNSYR